MDFDFSEQQYMFRDTFKGFLEANFTLEQVRGIVDRAETSDDLWTQLAELGTFGALVPEEYGGLGLTFVDVSLILEEFGRALIPPPIGETLACTEVLVRYGTAEQKNRLLPSVATGVAKLTPALSEAEGSFDPIAISMTAEPQGGAWRLTGQKIMVAEADNADYLLVNLRLGVDGPPALVLLEAGRTGISRRQHVTLDPTGRFFEVGFDGVVFEPGDIIGGIASADPVRRLFDVLAVIAATELLGISSKVLDEAVAYAGTRVQFGKPIGSFQAIKHRCADMAVAVETSRAAAYYAAWALAENAGDCGKAVSVAKSSCGDAARFICNEGIQIHGGMGFTWELGMHFFLRRTKLLEYSFGDAAYHRERLLQATLAELALAN